MTTFYFSIFALFPVKIYRMFYYTLFESKLCQKEAPKGCFELLLCFLLAACFALAAA